MYSLRILPFACVIAFAFDRVQAENLWLDAEPLEIGFNDPETKKSPFEWNEWQSEERNGWKYIEHFGAFFPWSNWIYHLDHGWLYPVGDNLNNIWFYSLKLNKNWIWSQTPFEVFFIPQSEGYFLYQKDSRGEFFHDIQKQEWIYWYELPKLFETDLSWKESEPPTEMVLVEQGQFRMGGVKDGEKYKDEGVVYGKDNGKYDVGEYFEDADGDGVYDTPDRKGEGGEEFRDEGVVLGKDNGKYDEGEVFDDTNGNGRYDPPQGYYDEYPQHTVDVSPFYISQFEVTNRLWNEVVEWATSRPDKSLQERDSFTYQFDSLDYVDYNLIQGAYRKLLIAQQDYQSESSAKNQKQVESKLAAFNSAIAKRDSKINEILAYRNSKPTHPVNYVNWSDVVKWCNAYSEMTGRTPVYHVDRGLAGVYRTSREGSVVKLENGYVKWYENGFRLPTESEWEKAARGGLDGKLYTSGDTIDSFLENIAGSDGQMAVGSYPPNGYDLYDMGGNLQEWCWDWKSYYQNTDNILVDPRGPASLKANSAEGLGGDNGNSYGHRVFRGGRWDFNKFHSRVSSRSSYYQYLPSKNISFRFVIGLHRE